MIPKLPPQQRAQPAARRQCPLVRSISENISAQWHVCSNYRSGNLNEYAIYLEGKHGPGILQEFNKLWLTPKKWTREEIVAKRKIFDDAFAQVGLGGLEVIREL